MKNEGLAEIIMIAVLLGLVIWLAISLEICQTRNESYEELYNVNLITDLNAEITVTPGNKPLNLDYNYTKDSLIKDLFRNNPYSIQILLM